MLITVWQIKQGNTNIEKASKNSAVYLKCFAVVCVLKSIFHAEAGIVLHLLLNIQQNWALFSNKIVLTKKCNFIVLVECA